MRYQAALRPEDAGGGAPLPCVEPSGNERRGSTAAGQRDFLRRDVGISLAGKS
jgi:hypothetical protein